MPNSHFRVKLDHAAIATSNLQKLLHVLRLLGLEDQGAEDVETQGVRAYFWEPKPGLTKVEVLDPIKPESTIQKYIDKRGAGIHHLSFMLEKGRLDDLCEYLKKNGVRLTYEEPQAGAHDTRVNFIHPESAGGILIEISEKSAK